MRHGLGRARDVLVVADGAVWIWNLVGDRFANARQRLDLAHASQHLWAVARASHPDDEATARAWVEPVLAKLRSEESVEVIEDLTAVASRLGGGRRWKPSATTWRRIGSGWTTRRGRAAGQRGDGIDVSAISVSVQTAGAILEHDGRTFFRLSY